LGRSNQPAGELSLLTEPADGYQSIDQLIAVARHTINLTIYELEDTQVEGALVAAHHRGVAVRVLLDHAYSGATVNAAAYTVLQAGGVSVRWTTGSVIFHQKTLTVDDDASAIMTGNLTSDDYPTTRDFIVIDRNAAAVSAIDTVFDEDWGDQPVEPGPAVGGLVWSPGAEPALLELIASAHRSLIIENEEMDSESIEAALESASRRGVRVEVVMTADSRWDNAFDRLASAGVHVATSPDNPGVPYIHAKAIVADGTTAFIGSENFSTSSLVYNRELGLTTVDPTIVDSVLGTLTSDFGGAIPWRTGPS
jgi:phosphatidylserine/phosphatidylglycerophosphate/cardiolipin synthase-like enzyme